MVKDSPSHSATRIEKDALGEVSVPAAHLWGAQTQRSIENFPIGVDGFRWGRPVIRAFGVLKKAAAIANGELGELARDKVALDRARGAGSDRRHARRGVSARRVPDRLRHADRT